MSRLPFILPPGAFRLLLAGLVLINHLSRIEVGRLGVILFFVLSGYWISDLWRREGDRPDIGLFFLNRFLRIWPLYIVVVLVAAALLARPLTLPNIAIFGVASRQGPNPLGVEWSLDIEAQFYLLLPLLMWVGLNWKSVIALSFACILAWIVVKQAQVATVFMYLPAFGAGILMYQLRSRELVKGGLIASLSILSFLLLTILFALLPATSGMLNGKLPNRIDPDIFAMIWMMPLLPYIAVSLRCRSGILDRHLGNLSFPLYLVHMPAIFLIRPETLPEKGLTALIALAVALIFYVVLDLPIERFRHSLLAILKQRRRTLTS